MLFSDTRIEQNAEKKTIKAIFFFLSRKCQLIETLNKQINNVVQHYLDLSNFFGAKLFSSNDILKFCYAVLFLHT